MKAEKKRCDAVYSAPIRFGYTLSTSVRRVSLRVRRSLTIKQMAMVALVSVVFIFVFVVVLLFHFVQQNRYNTATQMESIAHTVRKPLSAAILKADIPQAERILNRIQPAGVIGRADVVLPNQFQALRVRFTPERPVPVVISRVFELPVQITLPLYSLDRPTNPQPLAYLVLQADAWQMYKFIVNTISTLTTTWLLLALVMSVAITWCINRLVVHPLRKMAKALDGLKASDIIGHRLSVPHLHQDDEIGMLALSYNRNQQRQAQSQQDARTLSASFPGVGLVNTSLLLALPERTEAACATLLVVVCETPADAPAVLSESQRQHLLPALVEKIRAVLPAHTVLAQVSHDDFAILPATACSPWQAMTIARNIVETLNAHLLALSLPVKPRVSVGIATGNSGAFGEGLYHQAYSAACVARHHSASPIHFSDPEQAALIHRYMADELAVLQAMKSGDIAIWLQPQVELHTGHIVSAQVVLRQRTAQGDWTLPEGFVERVKNSELDVHAGRWILDEICRLLAECERRELSLALSINLSELLLLNRQTGKTLTEMLHRYRINPGLLILEITEHQHLRFPWLATDVLRPLHDIGVRIALMDAGMVRYCSDTTIAASILKISNATDMLAEDDTMIALITRLAVKRGLQVMADGVESALQETQLRNAGVKIGQGRFYGKPLPPPRMMALLQPDAESRREGR